MIGGLIYFIETEQNKTNPKISYIKSKLKSISLFLEIIYGRKVCQ